MLPSGYTECASAVGVYDTGVLSQSGLEINGLFNHRDYTSGYIFGARNSNSNTSAGQLDLLVGSTTYFGYNNARSSVYSIAGVQGDIHVYAMDNSFQWSSERMIGSVSPTASTFTGTRTIYVNALNNAGAIASANGGRIRGFVISQNGADLCDLVPCRRESDSVFGMYDLVSNTFIAPIQTDSSSFHKLTIGSSVGGVGYILNTHEERVNEMYMDSRAQSGSVPCRCFAEANDGYRFSYWNKDGSFLTRKMELEAEYSADAVLTPIFEKVYEPNNGGHNFMAEVRSAESNVKKTYLRILSASVNADALQKTTSTFECEEIPSNIKEGMTIRVYSPKNDTVCYGVIKSIEDKKIHVRELLSLTDREYIFKTSTINANLNAIYQIYNLLENSIYARDFSTDNTKIDSLLFRYLSRIGFMTGSSFGYKLSLYHDKNSNISLPKFTETTAQNLEDLLMEYAGFGIFIKALDDHNVTPFYYMRNEKMSLSDNVENITNIKVEQQTQEDNVLVIFNPEGTSIRGMYGVMLDGTIGKYDYTSTNESQFLASTNYHGKVVMSDEEINTLLAQNLSSSALNHKITFDISFSEMLPMKKFSIGVPVDFYIGNRLYKSVITAMNYNIVENNEQITSATITLGNVRNSLTSKLNIRKKQ